MLSTIFSNNACIKMMIIMIMLATTTRRRRRRDDDGSDADFREKHYFKQNNNKLVQFNDADDNATVTFILNHCITYHRQHQVVLFLPPGVRRPRSARRNDRPPTASCCHCRRRPARPCTVARAAPRTRSVSTTPPCTPCRASSPGGRAWTTRAPPRRTSTGTPTTSTWSPRRWRRNGPRRRSCDRQRHRGNVGLRRPGDDNEKMDVHRCRAAGSGGLASARVVLQLTHQFFHNQRPVIQLPLLPPLLLRKLECLRFQHCPTSCPIVSNIVLLVVPLFPT